MARGYAKTNTEAIASDMRASGVTIQQPRQQTVVEYFKDKPNRSLKGLYKAGTNIEFLNGRTGKFGPARVLEVTDKNIVLFPIFKTEGLDMAAIGSIKLTIERGPDGKPIGLRSKKYNIRAGL